MPPAKVRPREGDTEPLLDDSSPGAVNLCGCSRRDRLRKSVINLVGPIERPNEGFDMLILMVIIANSAMMATDSPLDTDRTTAKALLISKLEILFNVIFTIEMTLKIIAYGLRPYLGDAWNLLDVTVVMTAWAPYVLPTSGNYSAIRTIRVLRALRTVKRVKSLKQVIETLLTSLPELANVAVLFCFFLFLFGIIGVNLFAGKLHYRCTERGSDVWVDDTAICASDADCEPSQSCVYYEQNPSDGALSYDNCLYAFITIFQAVSLEGWVDQMYMFMVATEPTEAVVYYIMLVIFGAMFIVNLFLAVIFEAFIENQPEGMKELANVEGTKVAKPTGWEWIVYALIVGNTVTMCMTHDGQSQETTDLIAYANYFFTIAFAFEMVIKLFTYKPRAYFASGWNTFDFVVTWASLIDLVLDFFHRDTDFLRALRVARVMRLLRLNEDMRRFEATAAKVFNHVLNLSGVLILILFVFALLGMELFGGKMGDTRTNFDYFSSAFVTVFCVCSGEDWNAVFAESLQAGNVWVSVGYFITLFILGNYILVNLFVAIICWGWDCSISEPDEGPQTEEERLLLERSKLELSHNLSKLRTEHAELLLELQELIDQRQLGFSAASGSRLMARMGSLMKDFESQADQADSETTVAVAGLTLGFASLVKGLETLLDDAGMPEATPEVALLCEYWDSEHARNGGSSSGAPGSTAAMQSIMRRYITTITANRTLMGVVAGLRDKERARRTALPARIRVNPAAAKGDDDYGNPGAVSVAIGADPLGSQFLPLTLDGTYGPCIRQLRAIVTHPTFDNVIIFAILCSSLSLAFDMPSVQPGSPTANTLELLDYFFTTLFLSEMLLKLTVFGAFTQPDGYFLSGWNILDGSIVTVSVISILMPTGEGLGVFKALRALRTLRPLRVIQRFKALKQVVNSLFRAMPAVINVSQVCGLIMIVYGLFGMQFLMGRMKECNDPSKSTPDECVGTFTNEEGETLPRWWGNDDIGNFDNIFMASLTLFEMSTLEMWPDVMFRAMDTDPESAGHALSLNANPTMALYIISWIIVSAFFLLNLFVGVVLENFNKIREDENGSGLMSDDQKEWSKTLQNVLSVRAVKAVKPPGGKSPWAKFRKAVFMVVEGDKEHTEVPIAFEKFIISLVLLNVLCMSLTWYDQPHYMDDFADLADVFFTAAFTIEMTLKITALGLRQYLQNPWNIFDGTLVTGSLAADLLQGLSAVGIAVDPATLRMLRIFRIARLLRLIKGVEGLNRLIRTIVISVPALANVGVLLFLFLYIYTVLGVELFHNLPLNGEFINADANFATFGTAMLTLFRCITGESYNGIMHDAMIGEKTHAPGRCTEAEGNCGNPAIAVPFFLTFVVLEAMVMLNLIVAVVLDTFAEEDAAEKVKLPASQIEAFVEAWKDNDPNATHFMPTKDLRKLLLALKPPLGFKGTELSASDVTQKLTKLEVPDRNGNVAFHDVLEALGKVNFGDEGVTPRKLELPPGVEGVKQITKAYAEVFKATELHKTVISQYSSAYIYAVIRMQNAIRKKLAKKRNSPDAGRQGNAFKDAARKKAAAQAGAAGSNRGGAPPKGTPKRR